LGFEKLFPKIKFFTQYHLLHKDFDNIHEVDAITGACIITKLKYMQEVDFFDERFFMYHEEQDLQFQLYKAGKKRLIIDGPQIIHLEGKSSDKQKDEILSLSSFSSIHCTISMMKFFKKNYFRRFSVKLLILKLLKTLLWLNPLLIKKNLKYIRELYG
jgi:hypothetical protein